MYVYGPVPSRRLGRSLGVSPIPRKTCSYTCVYCQLGHTRPLTVERSSFFPPDEILREIALRAGKVDIDYVTFVGDGEPTLCRDLGLLITEAKTALNVPAAVVTNGSLLHRDDVRADLQAADIVLPTLDAGDESLFRKINRPHRSLSFATVLDGLIAFRREYAGQIWLEVMLVAGVNDGENQLHAIREAVEWVNPDRVYITTPIRPPAEPWVHPPEAEAILRAQAIIGGGIPVAAAEDGSFDLHGFADAREAIVEIGSRHPLRREQAEKIAGAFGTPEMVGVMIGRGDVIEVRFEGRTFLLPSFFQR